jgi:hypothetical protein
MISCYNWPLPRDVSDYLVNLKTRRLNFPEMLIEVGGVYIHSDVCMC